MSDEFKEIGLDLEALIILDDLIKREEIDYGSVAGNRSAAIRFMNNQRILQSAVISKLDKEIDKLKKLLGKPDLDLDQSAVDAYLKLTLE